MGRHAFHTADLAAMARALGADVVRTTDGRWLLVHAITADYLGRTKSDAATELARRIHHRPQEN